MSGRGSELPALFILSRSHDVSVGPMLNPLRSFLTLCIICIHESRNVRLWAPCQSPVPRYSSLCLTESVKNGN